MLSPKQAVQSSQGPERRRAPTANERLDWRDECFEALDVTAFKQAPRKGVGEFISPAPLPSGERPFPSAGDPPASMDVLTSDEVMRLNTGWQQSPERWRESVRRRRILAKQTARMADSLEQLGGIRARLSVAMSAIGNATGGIDSEDCYRAIRFLPLIAQRERRPVLNALRYFQRNDPSGAHLRYAVITAGRRVPAWGDLRGAMAHLHRQVSRWAHDADRDWGMEVLYRGTEFTRDGGPSYHPHANVLYVPRRPMSKAKWAAFLKWSHMRLGAHWRDNGRLKDADEAIKYPFKPAELDDAPGDELVWLWWETHRMKFAQPMGAFAEFRRQLQRDGQKVAMVNRRGGARLEIVTKSKRDPLDEKAESDPRRENLILCRTAPQFRFGPFAEPITMVANYTDQPTTAEGRQRLAIIRAWNDQAQEWWQASGAPLPQIAKAIAAGQAAARPGEAGRVAAFNVHTRRPTVQTRGCLQLDDGTRYDPDTGEIIPRQVAGARP
jgi:hypothetical protein